MITKPFTKEEMKRLKFCKMRDGMTEKEAEAWITYLASEVIATHEAFRKQVLKAKAKKKPKKLLIPIEREERA